MTQATGQTPFEVFPSLETEFFPKVVDAQLTFVRGRMAGSIRSCFTMGEGMWRGGARGRMGVALDHPENSALHFEAYDYRNQNVPGMVAGVNESGLRKTPGRFSASWLRAAPVKSARWANTEISIGSQPERQTVAKEIPWWTRR